MKVALTCILSVLVISLHAQQIVKPENSPKREAQIKVRELQLPLLLSDAAKDSLYQIFFTQALLRDSIKYYRATSPTKIQQFQILYSKSNSKIDSLLTADQRLKFGQWKKGLLKH